MIPKKTVCPPHLHGAIMTMYGISTSFGHNIRLLMLADHWQSFGANFILFITAALTRPKLLLIKRNVSGMDVITG